MFAALCHCCLDEARMGPTRGTRSNDSLSVAVITESSTQCPCAFLFFSPVTQRPLATLCSMLCPTLFIVFCLVSFFSFLGHLTCASVFIICCHRFSHTCPVALHFSLLALADAPPAVHQTACAFRTVQRFRLALLASLCYFEEHGDIVLCLS